MKKSLFLFAILLLPAMAYAQLSVSFSSFVNPTCFAGCNGSATATATGGVPPYAYLWMPGNITTPTISNLCAGSYTCTVTDQASTTASAILTLVAPTAITLATIPSTSATVCIGSSVSYSLNAIGGTPPYAYSWTFPGGSPSSATTQNPVITYNTAGTYMTSVTVQDGNGCTALTNISITVSASTVGGTVSGSASVCSNGNNGNLVLSGHTGNVLHWEFSNDGGLTWINVSNVTTTFSYSNVTQNRLYRALVQSGSCPAAYSTTASLTVVAAPVVTISPSSPTICSGSSVTLTASGATTYTWVPGNLTGSSIILTPTTTTTYTVTGTNASGCMDTDVVTVFVNQSPMATTSGVNPTCNNADGSVTVVATGISPFTYLWSPFGGTAATENNLPAGGYTVLVTDPNGCTVSTFRTLLDSCDYVWPGDANDDAVADNIDILDIGIANGATGTTRANATTTWVGQPSTAWGQTLLSGTDYKWVDCDGNGAINPVDTQAVVLNFGMTHNNRYAAPTYTESAPALGISFDQDSLAAGSTGTITLSLGDATNPANGVYGVAFRLNYDAAQMSTASFGMTGGTSWFGTAGNDLMRVVLHPSPSNGYVDVAITRLDQQDVSGSGTLGQIYFTATTNLAGSGNAMVVPMNLTNVVLVNSGGVQQPVNVMNDSIVIADSAVITGIPQQASEEFEVYPNPANENVQVVIPGTEQQLVTLTDLSGRIVYSAFLPAGINSIAVSEIPSGTYIMQVSAGDASQVERITIMH